LSLNAQFKEFLIEQMADFGPVTIRAMFGGAGVMRDGLMFALIDDEVLYLKADDETKAAFVAENLTQFTYMSKGGKKMEMAYWRIPERCLDDADEMAQWCRVAFGVALKAAAKKKSKTRARK
jgi:DNA transformation protein